MRLKEHFRRFRAFLIDCDGVIWRGFNPIPSALKAVEELRKEGKLVVFVTNNSTLSRKGYVEKFKRLGLKVKESEVFPSSYVTARFLSEKDADDVFVIGEEGLVEELLNKDLKVIEWGDADYVVVGMDRTLTYWKLAHALRLIRKGSIFVATNRDRTLPTSEGEIPGAGSIVAALEEASGKSPDVEIGKPSTLIFEFVLKEINVSKDESLIIGDRLETDVKGAVNLGAKSALVLTGIAKLEDIIKSDIKPDYVLNTLLDLFE